MEQETINLKLGSSVTDGFCKGRLVSIEKGIAKVHCLDKRKLGHSEYNYVEIEKLSWTPIILPKRRKKMYRSKIALGSFSARDIYTMWRCLCGHVDEEHDKFPHGWVSSSLKYRLWRSLNKSELLHLHIKSGQLQPGNYGDRKD